MGCRWKSMGTRGTPFYEELLHRCYFKRRRNSLNETLNLEAQEAQPNKHRDVGGNPWGSVHFAIRWRYHKKTRSRWLPDMGAKWRSKNSTSLVVWRRARHQQRMWTGGSFGSAEMGKISKFGAWWLDDHRRFQLDIRILQQEIQATTEVPTRCTNNKIHNQSTTWKSRLSTCLSKIQLISRLVS